MPASAKGSFGVHRGRYFARVLLPGGKRIAVQMPAVSTDSEARARSLILKQLAQEAAPIIATADSRLLDYVRSALEEAGKATNQRQIDAVRAHIVSVRDDGVVEIAPSKDTIRGIGERWTSGDLAREYPDHIREKSSSSEDAYRLERHIYPVSVVHSRAFTTAGDIQAAEFTLDHAEAVMRACELTEPGSRRQVAQALHRVLTMAVYPLKLREHNPLPRGWMPKPADRKALQWLYPDEDALLLKCVDVPLGHRVLYGFLAREGMRRSEAFALQWVDVDLVRGVVKLDKNKTNSPRAWVMSSGTVEALKRWRSMHDAPTVFVSVREKTMSDGHLAARFREHLQAAGVTREELFVRTKERLPIRIHDLRATFVTLALAHGKTEAWVKDRTGHTSSEMLERYRRAARTAEELGMPELTRLDEAVPELRDGARLR